MHNLNITWQYTTPIPGGCGKSKLQGFIDPGNLDISVVVLEQ